MFDDHDPPDPLFVPEQIDLDALFAGNDRDLDALLAKLAEPLDLDALLTELDQRQPSLEALLADLAAEPWPEPEPFDLTDFIEADRALQRHLERQLESHDADLAKLLERFDAEHIGLDPFS